MKYGYNDNEWNDKRAVGPISMAIKMFNIDGFRPFMKRKTVRKGELEMLAALTEMVQTMNEHVKNMEVKD